MKLSTTRAAKPLRRTAIITAILMSVSTLSTSVNGAEKRPIGDLEIYQSLLPGNPKLMIMIDVSSSMRKGSIQKDYGQPCDSSGKNSSYGKVGGSKDDVIITIDGSTTDIEFQAYGCQAIKGGGEKEIDRLSRFQITLMRLLADEVFIGNESAGGNGAGTSLQGRLLPDSYAMGIGIFGYESTGEKATILEPIGLLTNEKRRRLINKINSIVDPTSGDIKVNGVSKSTKDTVTSQGVSIASALVEAGAYMMGTSPIDTAVPQLNSTYSGFGDSDPATKANPNDRYFAPTVDQCSGKGIFMLTDDGLKKSGSMASTSTDPIASLANVQMMNKSLNKSALDTTLLNQCTTEFSGAWKCTGAYARALRNPNNPSGHSIKTATAGIGKAFDIFGTTTQQITVDGKNVTVANCSATGASTDAQNLCKLGELKADATAAYGNGKFYPIPTTTIDSENAARTIATSISDFASGLGGIGTAGPAGTITVPNNPYQVSEQLAFAYLPMLRPDIGSTTSVWSGNLKKYNLNNGTLYGQSNSALYTDTAGSLSTATRDLWQATTTTTGNSAIDVGGVYAKLTTPQSGLASARTVYVEDITAVGSTTPILRKVGVDAAGKLVGFSALLDTTTYTEQNKRRILNFLGFKQYKINSTSAEPKELLDISGNTPSGSTALSADTVMIQPTEAVRVLGGVVHSKPAAISYSATLDANGNITSTREDYALFGSMDGALHLVDAANDSGIEKFAIIPKKMIADQSIALVKDSKKDAVGQPYFGVDAPWLVTTDYTYSLTTPTTTATTETATSKVTVDTSSGNGMFAYGGLRMGGEALYGINISDKDAPSMMFAITPSTAGFGRMGQTWSKPTAAKIRTSQSGNPIDVLVFGGGYDMQYESDIYKATSAAPAQGNSIYIVNANSGELIWSASKSDSITNNDDMIHSITGGITVLDRDNDGLMDHIYAADLGGQVFRADFQNARPAKFGFAEVSGFSNKRVVRILNTDSTGNPATYRFYERPVVSFYRNESISNETISNAGKIFALVNVVSGDRSSPLSKVRSNNTYANRVYGIIDTDVTDSTLYDKTDTSLSIKDLTENSLLNLNTEIEVTASTTANALQTKKTTARNKLIRGTNKGWYYPLTRFDGYQGVKYNKGIGESMVINSLLYTTVYNPDKMYTAPQSCTTSILGGSERQVYCLPYGICSDANSKNGTGGYIPAGQGIQELTLGAFNSSNTDIKVLIGTRTLTDRIDPTNRIAYGAGDTTSKYYDPNSTNQNKLEAFANLGSAVGGDGSAVEYLFSERYTLQPKTWYERE